MVACLSSHRRRLRDALLVLSACHGESLLCMHQVICERCSRHLGIGDDIFGPTHLSNVKAIGGVVRLLWRQGQPTIALQTLWALGAGPPAPKRQQSPH